MTSTAAATARALADAGITRVFGLPGGEVLVLMDELRRAGIDFVLMRHESNAGIAAAVYGKLRGQPGVVLTTLGPGAANLMLPLCGSYSIRSRCSDLGPDPRRLPRQPRTSCHCTTPTGRSRVRGQDHRRQRLRCRAARAGEVHGAPLRRVVSHALRSRRQPSGAGHASGFRVQGSRFRVQHRGGSRARDASGALGSAKRPLS
jgi:hypothetical protein